MNHTVPSKIITAVSKKVSPAYEQQQDWGFIISLAEDVERTVDTCLQDMMQMLCSVPLTLPNPHSTKWLDLPSLLRSISTMAQW